MKHTTTLKQSRTTTRTGKKPYVYAFASGTVTGSTSSAPSVKTLAKRSSDRTGAMPSHWRRAVA